VEEANLARISHMARAFGCEAGLSDHTMGIAVPVAAVALGASVIEKHLCMSRAEPGPDSAFSLEPDEFRTMVDAIRIAEKAVGAVTYERTEKEKSGLAFRRSLFFIRDMQPGEIVDLDSVKVVRPGQGLAPVHLEAILGRPLRRSVTRGTPVSWDVF
jgi:N-acetylneuraminate synthase